MTKKRLLLLFSAAGLILAAVLGMYVYRLNLGPTRDDVAGLLEHFTGKISENDLDGARALMAAETRGLLRDPGTILGETVYRELKLKSVDRIYSEGNGSYAADVVLTTPDTLKIMTKAGLLFAEQVSAEGPAEDADQLLLDIYEEILSRDDIPVIDSFCVIRMENREGKLLILGDAALQTALEGGLSENSAVFDKLTTQ